MKLIMLSVVFEIASEIALAQGAPDPMAQLRACSLLDPAERPACLNKLPQPGKVPAPAAGDAEGWIISETTSPVDYTPIVTATTFAQGNANPALKQLSIHCRGGRTEMVVAGAAVSDSGIDYALSYRLDGGQPSSVPAGRPSYGTGVAFRGDVVGLLLSLVPLFVSPTDAIVGAEIGYLSLWSIYWLFKLLTGKEGMGYGDFKLLGALGAWMGAKSLLPIVLLSSVVGAILGSIILAMRGKNSSTPIPFGPFIAVAGWIQFIWGEQLLRLYTQVLLGR